MSKKDANPAHAETDPMAVPSFTDEEIPTETRASKYSVGPWVEALTGIPEGKARSFTFPYKTTEEHAVADQIPNVIRQTAVAVRPAKTLRIKRTVKHGESVIFTCWWVDKITRPRSGN